MWRNGSRDSGLQERELILKQIKKWGSHLGGHRENIPTSQQKSTYTEHRVAGRR